MEDNIAIVERFYTAFSQRDHRSMNACYSDSIIFSDPAFGVLRGEEVKAMWEMLCTRATDLRIEFSNIQLVDHEYATCNWVAHYTFTGSGRKVINRIKAFMKLEDGKIIEHSDAFKLSNWAAQALGLKGILLGWSGFMKKKIQKMARKNLITFIEKKNMQ